MKMGSEPVNLENCDVKALKELFDSIEFVLSDCDGVLWHPAPSVEAGKFINHMKKLGKKVHFVSNNSLRPKEEYTRKFNSAGIENGTENLIVPSTAIAEYLKSQNFDKHIYCVTCSETERVLKSYGFKCKSGPVNASGSYSEFVSYLEDDLEIGAVVFDSDFAINLAKLNKAITYLKRPDVLYLNGATDKFISLSPGTLTISPTFIADIAGEVTKREPIQLAKPGILIGELAMKQAGVTDPSKVLFIGDMIDQDVRLGKNVGFKTLLVLTNLSYKDMQEHEIKPDFYAKDLDCLVPKLSKI